MTAVFALASPTFQPAMRVITAITQANPASITTSFAHNYGSGEIIRIFIPQGYGFGMPQMNNKSRLINVTSPTTFTIAIDSSQFDAFAVPAGNLQNAQALPEAEQNSTLQFATKNVL
jgi:hypothetical protein